MARYRATFLMLLIVFGSATFGILLLSFLSLAWYSAPVQQVTYYLATVNTLQNLAILYLIVSHYRVRMATKKLVRKIWPHRGPRRWFFFRSRNERLRIREWRKIHTKHKARRNVLYDEIDTEELPLFSHSPFTALTDYE